MSRRLTGWVLTAAAIAAGPAPALCSSDLNNNLGQHFRPTVAHVGSVQPLREGIRSLAGDDRDYTNCLEVNPGQFMAFRNGTVLHLESGLPTKDASKGPPVDIYEPERPEEGILGEIARAKRGGADQAMPPGPLLIGRDLPPSGMVQPDHIKAACGIPGGLTLLVPAMRELRRAAGAMS